MGTIEEQALAYINWSHGYEDGYLREDELEIAHYAIVIETAKKMDAIKQPDTTLQEALAWYSNLSEGKMFADAVRLAVKLQEERD